MCWKHYAISASPRRPARLSCPAAAPSDVQRGLRCVTCSAAYFLTLSHTFSNLLKLSQTFSNFLWLSLTFSNLLQPSPTFSNLLSLTFSNILQPSFSNLLWTFSEPSEDWPWGDPGNPGKPYETVRQGDLLLIWHFVCVKVVNSSDKLWKNVKKYGQVITSIDTYRKVSKK